MVVREDNQGLGATGLELLHPVAQLREPLVAPSSVVELEVSEHDLLLAAVVAQAMRLAGVRGQGEVGGRILRRKKDPFFGKACKFLHPETRGCTIYEGRPQACREYPGKSRCGYYDVLQFAREIQNDPTIVPIVRLTFKKQLRATAR